MKCFQQILSETSGKNWFLFFFIWRINWHKYILNYILFQFSKLSENEFDRRILTTWQPRTFHSQNSIYNYYIDWWYMYYGLGYFFLYFSVVLLKVIIILKKLRNDIILNCNELLLGVSEKRFSEYWWIMLDAPEECQICCNVRIWWMR